MNVLGCTTSIAVDETYSVGSLARTHVGKQRLLNEDRFLDCPEQRLWAVADGMGGHSAGDVAATLAIQALAEIATSEEPITLARIAGALEDANKRIFDQMRSHGATGGATMAGLWIDRKAKGHIFWLGDSRVYRRRGALLELLTHDHSVVQELIDQGLIAQADASGHPHAHVVTRALGVSATVEPECRSLDIQRGDSLLLCTDGLTAELSDDQIAGHMDDELAGSATALLQSALEHQARDNITFVLLGVT